MTWKNYVSLSIIPQMNQRANFCAFFSFIWEFLIKKVLFFSRSHSLIFSFSVWKKLYILPFSVMIYELTKIIYFRLRRKMFSASFFHLLLRSNRASLNVTSTCVIIDFTNYDNSCKTRRNK
jgi:hypothetical protein